MNTTRASFAVSRFDASTNWPQKEGMGEVLEERAKECISTWCRMFVGNKDAIRGSWPYN